MTTLSRACLVFAAAISTPAFAAGPSVIRLADGLNAGPAGDNNGPGAEQPSVAYITHGADKYVVTVWMSSQVQTRDRPYQCKCSSVKLDALAGPQIMANAVQITSNNGDRPCNHPKLATIEGTDKALWVYGSNDNQTNVQTYAEVLNYDCTQATTDRLRISRDANTNEGAPEVSFNGMRNGKYVLTAGYLSATNNGQSRAVGLEVEVTGTTATINDTYNRNIVSPANIGRPTIAKVSTDRSLFCSSKGNNRPPEEGVECALVNTTDGSVVWRNLIAASQPDATPRIYYNQPQIAVGENNRFYVQMEQSNGNGRDANNRRRGRGSTTTFLYTLEPDEAGPNVRDMISGVGLHQVHGTICSGAYGVDGAMHAAVFDAPITGSGIGNIQMVQFSVQDRTVKNIGGGQAVGAYNADSGYLANIYGQNPNTQGRDFLRCIGDVPNPGFGVTNGFRPDVKTFFVFPYAGHTGSQPLPTDNTPGEKNSLFLSFLPGHVPTPVAPVLNALTVHVSGDGMGSVLSSPTGVDNCSSPTCSVQFDQGVVVQLTATPAAGSTFVGWTGSCVGAGVCSVRMDVARDVTATFTAIGNPQPTLIPVNVALAGDGHGTVSSAPSGISCSTGLCVANFNRGATVTLTAVADASSNFIGWTGDCSGATTCQVTADAAKSVTATFNAKPGTTPEPSNTPSPSPSQIPNPTPGNQNADPKVGCSTMGNSSGTLFPIALAAAAILIARRRRVK
ncbi:MAG: hypothetical protein U1E65_02460 [Myxococcota bacterium]